MRNLLMTVSAVAMLAGHAALAQNAPAGGAATGCPIDGFVPVISERTGAILYWNNRGCPMAPGATDSPPAAAAAPAVGPALPRDPSTERPAPPPPPPPDDDENELPPYEFY